MDSPEETVQLIIAESERLTQYLNALPPEAWRTPSACKRWEVRDVVAHLAAQAEFYVEVISRSLQGDISTPEGRAAPAGPPRPTDLVRGWRPPRDSPGN